MTLQDEFGTMARIAEREALQARYGDRRGHGVARGVAVLPAVPAVMSGPPLPIRHPPTRAELIAAQALPPRQPTAKASVTAHAPIRATP